MGRLMGVGGGGGVGPVKEKVTYLQVFHWVPVMLHKDNGVGTSQV